MKKIKNAFTLAEVLITLGVIGVVAAITMPTLIQKHQEQVTVNKVKKFYSVMSQAYISVSNEYGYPLEWGNTTSHREASTRLAERFKPYLRILKDCGYEEGCFVNAKYKHADGSESINFLADNKYRYMMILNDGSAIAIMGTNTNRTLGIYYDINGTKGPNQFGRDLFQITDDGDKKLYIRQIEETDNFFDDCLTYGYTCAWWILTNGNMDYLHCPEYLKENPEKTKCK